MFQLFIYGKQGKVFGNKDFISRESPIFADFKNIII